MKVTRPEDKWGTEKSQLHVGYSVLLIEEKWRWHQKDKEDVNYCYHKKIRTRDNQDISIL